MQTSMISEEAKMRSPETIFLQWWDDPIQWCNHRVDHEEYEDTEYLRADLPPALTVEQRDAIVAGMVAIIREISEEYWAASWYSGIEYTIYKDASDTTQNHRLKVLSRLINGWIHVPVGEDDPQFIPMDEWLWLFEKWKGKRS